MKKIIGLVIGIAVVVALVGTGTWALFSDTETSEGNQMTAGVIDLEVDAEDESGEIFSAQDDPLPEIFNYLPANDIKPGDTGEVTISLHLKTDTNPADLWMQVLNIVDDPDGGINSEPECECEGGIWDNDTDTCSGETAVEDDISTKIDVFLWLDEGATAGWQNSDVPTENDDEEEGDNIYQDGELELYDGTLAGLATAGTDSDGVLTVMEDAVASTTYYVGFSWELQDVDNCYQGDYCTFDIKFGADQIVPD